MSALEFIDDVCIRYDYVTMVTSIQVLLNHLSEAKGHIIASLLCYLPRGSYYSVYICLTYFIFRCVRFEINLLIYRLTNELTTLFR